MSIFHFHGNAFTAEVGAVTVPAGISSKPELLAFLARAIPLPEYFGHNWDALEECLIDLDWLDRPRLILIHHDIPLQAHPSEQRTYLEILAAAAQDSHRLRVTFPENLRPQLDRLLSPNRAD